MWNAIVSHQIMWSPSASSNLNSFIFFFVEREFQFTRKYFCYSTLTKLGQQRKNNLEWRKKPREKFRWHNWNQFNSHNNKRLELMLQHKTMFYGRVKTRKAEKRFGRIPESTLKLRRRLLFVICVCLFSHRNWMLFYVHFLGASRDFFLLSFMSPFFIIWCIISRQNRKRTWNEMVRI